MGLCQQEAQKEIDNVGALYCWLSYVNSLVLIAPFCFGCLVRLDPFFVNMLLSLLIKKKRGWGGGGGGGGVLVLGVGRIMLIKSMLSSLFLYFMYILHLSRIVRLRVEHILRNFL